MAKTSKKATRRTPARGNSGGRGGAQSTPQLEDFVADGQAYERGFHLPFKNGYEGKVKPGTAILDKVNNADVVKMQIQVEGVGTEFYSQWLNTQVGWNMFITDLKAMGFDPPSDPSKAREELGEILSQTDNLPVRFNVVQGKDKDGTPNEFVNVNITAVLESGNHSPTAEDTDTSEPAYDKDSILEAGDNAENDVADDQKWLEDINVAERLGLNPDEYSWSEFALAIVEELKL